MANKLSRIVDKLGILPSALRRQALSAVMGQFVPFVGTAGVVIEEMNAEQVIASLPNRRRVRNHIRGLHAAALTLLAETATGFVVGLNLPDDKLPLMKSLQVDFVKRCKGGLRVVASLTDEQREEMLSQPKGEVAVSLEVQDDSGQAPIQTKMIWAWVPKKRD